MLFDARRFLLETPLGRIILVLPRLAVAIRQSGVVAKTARAVLWALKSRDIAERSYDTEPLNQDELCSTISMVSGVPLAQIQSYRNEIVNTQELQAFVQAAVANAPERWSHDDDFRLGRRLAYYLLVRAIRPLQVIEAGVDRGFGAVLICQALARNSEEGAPGEYVGLDRKEPDSAFFYQAYSGKNGRLEHGDAVQLLGNLSGQHSLIIHDTCAEPNHLNAFTAAIDAILTDDTVIISSWTTAAFVNWAQRRGRCFLTHHDAPLRHWSNGSRLLFVFPRRP